MPLDGSPALRHAAPRAAALEARRSERRRPRAAAACRRSSARCSTCDGSETCRDSRFRRASSSSCAAAIRVRSSRCSSTTGSIWCRSPRSRRAPCASSRTALTVVRDGAQALALGRIYERAGLLDRAAACYRRGGGLSIRSRSAVEALYRLGLRCRRERRFGEAAAIWREVVALTETRSAAPQRDAGRRSGSSPPRRWRFITSTGTAT